DAPKTTTGRSKAPPSSSQSPPWAHLADSQAQKNGTPARNADASAVGNFSQARFEIASATKYNPTEASIISAWRIGALVCCWFLRIDKN
ncbi:MAG: hypothetical protein LBT62_08150, partial [Deltaproteobacteria bacterium]|nr:hypothetical protein [Deltaproteobacteria bacterium]